MTARGTMAAALALLACSATGPAAAGACVEPKDAPILSPPLAESVIGKGRLQFYSAPDERCRMEGVFVVPKDEVIAYAETADGWTSVMYVNPNTNRDVQGWVRSKRLKIKGTIAPRQ
jgi:hypothetical protein